MIMITYCASVFGNARRKKRLFVFGNREISKYDYVHVAVYIESIEEQFTIHR